MHTRSEMREMTREELNLIAQGKNKRGRVTPEAKYAQELIWKRRFYTERRFYDEYEGWLDVYDEEFQEYLDFENELDFIG